MRRIVTAISAAALALSLVAQATPASAAVTGYDSAYAGESAFLTLNRGETGTFTVFFANTGSSTWIKGGSTQVDLAACMENKTTCNVQDASDAPFNSGWLSASRYATTTQTGVSPGQIGTFTYNVKVPAAQAAGTYRFNGALVLASSGADIHNEGYYQDVTVPAAAAGATITSIDPTEGSDEGGDNVVVTGSGFVCTPAPTVNFGSAAATILSCGATSMTVTTPAHAIPPGEASDTVDVTVTNSGGTASNAVEFTYNLTSAPTFDAVTASGSKVTLWFSQPVCVNGGSATEGSAGGDSLEVTVNGDTTDESNDSFADCVDGDFSDTATVTLDTPLTTGDTVVVRITNDGADTVENAAGISMDSGQTRSATVEEDTTAPKISGASAADSTEVNVSWNDALNCNSVDTPDFELTDPDGDAVDLRRVQCADGSDTIDLWTADTGDISSEGTWTVTYVGEEVEDLSGNAAGESSATFDVTAPIITSAEATDAIGFTVDTPDTFELIFDQGMDTTDDAQLLVEDEDGTTAVLSCDATPSDTPDGLIAVNCDNNYFQGSGGEDSMEIGFREDTFASGDLLADGTFAGLQWPLTITDQLGWVSKFGIDLDLDNSEDVTIER